MKLRMLGPVVLLALATTSASAEIAPTGEPFLDSSKSTLLLQEFKQGKPVTYLSTFCEPLLPGLMEVFGDARGQAMLGCLQTIHKINKGRTDWRNPDVIKSGQTMLLVSPANFAGENLVALKERVGEGVKVKTLASNPREMAEMLLAMSRNINTGGMTDEQMKQVRDDIAAAAAAAVEEVPGTEAFLKAVEDEVNRQLAEANSSAQPLDLSGLKADIAANTAAIEALDAKASANAKALDGKADVSTVALNTAAIESLQTQVNNLPAGGVGLSEEQTRVIAAEEATKAASLQGYSWANWLGGFALVTFGLMALGVTLRHYRWKKLEGRVVTLEAWQTRIARVTADWMFAPGEFPSQAELEALPVGDHIDLAIDGVDGTSKGVLHLNKVNVPETSDQGAKFRDMIHVPGLGNLKVDASHIRGRVRAAGLDGRLELQSYEEISRKEMPIFRHQEQEPPAKSEATLLRRAITGMSSGGARTASPDMA